VPLALINEFAGAPSIEDVIHLEHSSQHVNIGNWNGSNGNSSHNSGFRTTLIACSTDTLSIRSSTVILFSEYHQSKKTDRRYHTSLLLHNHV
jgi:hypothetical protein